MGWRTGSYASYPDQGRAHQQDWAPSYRRRGCTNWTQGYMGGNQEQWSPVPWNRAWAPQEIGHAGQGVTQIRTAQEPPGGKGSNKYQMNPGNPQVWTWMGGGQQQAQHSSPTEVQRIGSMLEQTMANQENKIRNQKRKGSEAGWAAE